MFPSLVDNDVCVAVFAVDLFCQDETALAGHLIQTGPLSVLMNAELLVFYHSGVWHPHSCKSAYDDLDHGKHCIGPVTRLSDLHGLHFMMHDSLLGS